MRNILIAILCLAFSCVLEAQELNCTITVNSDQIGQTNQKIFKTLERSLNDFINKTKWTNRVYSEQERVSARMFITVKEYESNRFKADIQLQSSRTVFNSSYESPVFNYKDNEFNFEYIEFQPLVFNKNVYNSNLIGVVSYYVYIILGLDADTFALEGGDDFYKRAQNIVAQARGGNYKGWVKSSGQTSGRTRFELADNLLSNTFREYRMAMYNYHIKGLDILASNNSMGKQVIYDTMSLFKTLVKRKPSAFLIQTFFDSKSEEIRDIFSDGSKVDLVKLKETLNKIAPFYSTTWNEIKY